MNDVDANRPIAQVRRLYEMARQLGYLDEAAHWRRVLEERGVSL